MFEYLNQLEHDEANAALEKCCATELWIEMMIALRPFVDDQSVLDAAATCWNKLDSESIRIAFTAHPRIGDVDSLREKFANTKRWASGEQASVDSASEQVLQNLARQNDAYFEKFGYIFIVCATGKSADEMLDILNSRLPNDPETEMRIASREQIKITLLRLRKLAEDE